MEIVIIPEVAFVAGGALVGGLVLLARGFAGYGRAARIADTSTSRINSMAIGEVRVSGTVEPAGVTLVSPLQSAECVYYGSWIRTSDGDLERTILEDERAVGFRVRDESGVVRVFPRGAAFDVPPILDETAPSGETPAGVRLRSGSAFGTGPLDREAQIAALLTVRPAASQDEVADAGSRFGIGLGPVVGSRGRRYREARIEPGQVVTVVGQVLPFDQLEDPDGADVGGASAGVAALRDPEIAADLAEARAAGLLEDTAEEAWGNAAIPGFGIGRPVSTPELHPEAATLRLAEPADAEAARQTFDIGPRDLVLAASAEVPLIIALGPPGQAAARQEGQFLLGLLGAIVSIVAAVVLAVMVSGGFGQ